MSVQSAFFRCENCGRDAPVKPTDRPYEFTVECECGRSYVLSWKHDETPPRFDGTPRPPIRSDER
jgi:hypothetical protein